MVGHVLIVAHFSCSLRRERLKRYEVEQYAAPGSVLLYSNTTSEGGEKTGEERKRMKNSNTFRDRGLDNQIYMSRDEFGS